MKRAFSSFRSTFSWKCSKFVKKKLCSKCWFQFNWWRIHTWRTMRFVFFIIASVFFLALLSKEISSCNITFFLASLRHFLESVATCLKSFATCETDSFVCVPHALDNEAGLRLLASGSSEADSKAGTKRGTQEASCISPGEGILDGSCVGGFCTGSKPLGSWTRTGSLFPSTVASSWLLTSASGSTWILDSSDKRPLCPQ